MFRKKFLYVFVVVSMVLNLVPINFVSADWGNSALIENIVGSGAYNQKIKMNDSGVAFAIWKDNNKIYTNKYINGVWESITPVQISEDAYGTANLPDIEVDNLGNAFAVWGQNNAIYTNKYINGEWSSTTTKISEDIYGSTSEPKIAMDNSGNTVAVWLQYDTIYKVFTNKYINGEWSSTTTKISIDLDGSSSGLNLDMDDSGNAVAIWYQTDAAKKIYTNNYNTSTFWGSANLLATIPLSSIETDVSLDDSGNAMAVWNDDSYAVYASKFTNGGSWGPAEEISNGGFVGQQPKPKVAMNSGNAFVAWHNSVDTKIYASKYSNGSWVNKKEIAGSTTSLGAFHQISMDDSGNATVVWNNLSSFTSDIYTNIYSSGSWSGTYTAMTGDNNYSTQPDIGMDASGNIVIVWSSAADDRSSASIYSNSYINNTAPTLTSLSVTPSTDGTGNVSIVSTVDDADANELSIAYHYNSGACTSLPSTTSTISSVTSANGTAVTSTGSYQVTTVTTTPGANTVTSTWDSLTDLPTADGT